MDLSSTIEQDVIYGSAHYLEVDRLPVRGNRR
jgi:hypothetical protein